MKYYVGVLIFVFQLLISKTVAQEIAEINYWAFSWPYSNNGRCVCQQATYGEYDSQEECLTAFENVEHCIYLRTGYTLKECQFAVSKVKDVTNEVCTDYCLVLGQENSYLDFNNNCMFENYHVFGGKTKIDGNCFSKYIFGHSDEDYNMPAYQVAIDQIRNVRDAATCQRHCQNNSDCYYWFWRKLPNSDEMAISDTSSNTYPFTCYLKNADMVNHARNSFLHADDRVETGLIMPDEYCDYTKDALCQSKLYDGWGNQRCLMCPCTAVCAWQSDYHISGPKYCVEDFNACGGEDVPPVTEQSSSSSTTSQPIIPYTPTQPPVRTPVPSTSSSTTPTTTTPPDDGEQPPVECKVPELEITSLITSQDARALNQEGPSFKVVDNGQGMFDVEVPLSFLRNVITTNAEINDVFLTFYVSYDLFNPHVPIGQSGSFLRVSDLYPLT